MKNSVSSDGGDHVRSVKDRLLSKKEVSQLWGVSVRTVEREVASGRLKRRKIRGCVRFWESDIVEIGKAIHS